jgi:hypothetical protein
MKRLRAMFTVLAAALALGAGASATSTASAQVWLHWHIMILTPNYLFLLLLLLFHYMPVKESVHGSTTYTIKTAIDTISCTSQALSNATVEEGEGEDNSASGKATIEFKGCTAKQGEKTCTIPGGTITTEPLKETLGYQTKEKTGRILTLFAPETGTVIAKTELVGCIEGGPVKLTGAAIAEPIDDENGKDDEVGKEQTTPSKDDSIKFSGSSAPKKLFVETNGVVSEKTASLELAGIAAKIEGETELETSAEVEIEETKEIEKSTEDTWTIDS